MWRTREPNQIHLTTGHHGMTCARARRAVRCEARCGELGLDQADRALRLFRCEPNPGVRAAPLVRANVKITVKNTVCPSLPFAAYGVFDCEFGFPSHEWSCS